MSISVDVADGVALLTLDEPDRRNALTLGMVGEITEAFDRFEAEGSEVGAVIVTGAGSAFCAGADLSHLGASGSDDGGRGIRSIYEGFLRVARSSLPTIAAVNGAAVGAGMNLALACDVRVAARRARFDTRFLQLGLHPGGGHTWMLHRAVGPEAAAAMVLFGEVVGAEDAERHGLVWKTVDDDQLLTAARVLAHRAAAAPTSLVSRVKSTLRAVPDLDDHDAAVDLELEAQAWSLQQPEFRQRLDALQKQISSKS
jgi:enoyl-CoA hydratase